LLSFPRLWRNAGSSSELEIQAHILRSKSTPLDVNLSHPSFADLITPHVSRLVGLTVILDKSSHIDQFIERLRYPIPSLHTFRISAPIDYPHKLQLPSGLDSPFFLHSKTLEIDGISSIYGPPSFPYVTEFTWHSSSEPSIQMVDFLRTLEQLPSLERVYITLRANLELGNHVAPRVATLPHVQEMSLSKFDKEGSKLVCFSSILGYLHLPRLKKLCVQGSPWFDVITHHTVFPITGFGEKFPNFAELPDLQVDMKSREATFRNPSGATLKYRTGVLVDYNIEMKVWRGLPLLSVRRLAVNAVPERELKDRWLIGLLGDLQSLEHLELECECDDAIQWLCDEMMREGGSIHIKTLIVRCGEHDCRRAHRWKHLADAAGIATTVICVPGTG
jgi:hypothetical protein